MAKMQIAVCSNCRKESCNGVVYHAVGDYDYYGIRHMDKKVCSGSLEEPDEIINSAGQYFYLFYCGHGVSFTVPATEI